MIIIERKTKNSYPVILSVYTAMGDFGVRNSSLIPLLIFGFTHCFIEKIRRIFIYDK